MRYVFMIACILVLSACGTSLTSTPAPTLTPIPLSKTPAPDVRIFHVVDDQSDIKYQAILQIGGLKMDGTFSTKGKIITMVPVGEGSTLDIDIQIDGNSVTGANSLVVDALKGNLETTKFPYEHFLAKTVQPLKFGPQPVQTMAVGTIELHGQSQPIELPITVTLIDHRLTATGSTTLELLNFGVNVPTALMKSQITFQANMTSQEDEAS
jgi:polyisoprenoid-binding protein YceI